MNKHYKLSKLFKVLSVLEVLSFDFGKNQRNRKINSNHVNDFVNVIKNGKSRIYLDDGTYLVFGLNPVIINPKTGHIMDSQHRLEAFKKAYQTGLIDENARILVGFWEVEDDEAENALIIDLNSHSKNWSLDDYMDCYAQYKEYFAMLKDFCSKHQLCISSKQGEKGYKYRYAAAMLTGKNQASVLKSGDFSFTEEQLKLGDAIHNEMVLIRKKLGLPMAGNDIEAMATVWYVHRNFFSVNDMKKLYYLPKDITSYLENKKRTNKADWEFIFSRIESEIDKIILKNKAA